MPLYAVCFLSAPAIVYNLSGPFEEKYITVSVISHVLNQAHFLQFNG